MGCTAYPQTAEFQQRLEKELYAVVLRLRSHPCIALWAGNNEDDVLIADGDFRAYKPDPNRDIVTRRTIPEALFALDPTRDYLPSSPWWSPELIRDYYTAKALPEDHLWGPRGYYKDPFYSQSNPLFASETGYHGMPCRESLEQMFTPGNVYPWTKGFEWNDEYVTKAVRKWKEDTDRDSRRNNLMTKQVGILFGDVPTNLDDFIFASQSVQGEALKYFIEMFRAGKFDTRTGILWWNIRDGWPIISDAVTDWYFRPKRAYWYIKQSQTDVCVMITDAMDGSHPIVAVNDTRKPVKCKITVRDATSGKTVWRGSTRLEANGRVELARLDSPKGQGIWLIEYEVDGSAKAHNHYLYGEPPFKLDEYRKLLGDSIHK